MTYYSSMLPVLFPIVLFAVTLVIIFILRAADKKSRGLTKVKALYDKYSRDCAESDTAFRQYASELEQTVARKDADVRELIQIVNTQLGELKTYSDDLVRLKNSMDTYRTALEGLGRLTSDADEKIQTVQDEVDRLGKVRTVIDGFRQDMKDADEHLRKHEQRVIQLERESVGRMNDAVSETDSSMDQAMESLHREVEDTLNDFKAKTESDIDMRLRRIDDTFQAVIRTVQLFFGELESKIDEARTVADNLAGIAAEASAVHGLPPVSGPASQPVQPSGDMMKDPFGPDDVQETVRKAPAMVQSADATISVQPAVAPEPERRPDVVMPSFKAPKFTPKSDEDFDQAETFPEDDDLDQPYGTGDDFAAFGGVDEIPHETDLRGMDIMDMDFGTQMDSGEDSSSLPSWARGSREPRNASRQNRWETYGSEEVVDFDDGDGSDLNS